MFQLLRLTFRQKKLVILSFACAVFVALFTSAQISLVQPIIDEMFKPVPAAAGPNPAVVPGAPVGGPAQAAEPVAAVKTRFMDNVWKTFRIDKSRVRGILPLALLIVIFGKGMFTFLATFLMKAAGNRIIKTMRDDLFKHVIYQSTSYFDQVTTGGLMSRLTNDVDRIQQAVSTSMIDLIEEAFILAGILAVMFATNWRMAVMGMVVTPLAVVPLAAFSRKLKKKGRQSQAKMAEMYNLIHETISGHRIVKAFGMERFELRKFLKASERYLRINLRLAWISSLSSPFMEFIGGIVAAFILYVGANSVAKGQLTPGDFGLFVTAIFSLFTPIKRLSRSNNVVQQAVSCLDRIQEVLDVPPQIQDNPGAYPLPPVQGLVRFEGVRFHYHADRPVLHDVTFEVQPRQTVALVGLSGAGKTTIINLLNRFYEPTAGRVAIDGIDIRDVTLASLRAQIGLVTQEIVLFNDTVRANIAYGQDDVPLDRIIAAATAAECHKFINDLPQGYETPIGERGGRLSVGQRQRLALARALLKNPPILILDEATSSLDSESERLIQQALDNIMKDRTTFIIAHRLSTIRRADMIMVVDKGRIAETGPHEKLVRKRGIYRKLYDLQFAENEEAAT
jgi:ATP-binding cassette, subfamily B, bacterial MsbA